MTPRRRKGPGRPPLGTKGEVPGKFSILLLSRHVVALLSLVDSGRARSVPEAIRFLIDEGWPRELDPGWRKAKKS